MKVVKVHSRAFVRYRECSLGKIHVVVGHLLMIVTG